MSVFTITIESDSPDTEAIARRGISTMAREFGMLPPPLYYEMSLIKMGIDNEVLDEWSVTLTDDEEIGYHGSR